MFIKAAAISGLAAVSSAHMLMTNPAPYGASTLTNSPLLADGSDFPCKARAGVYAPADKDNVYAQGSEQSLAFKGTATHGGGSCQVSVTTDLKPDQKSVWKVLKSFEGGCPARDQIGNMGNNPEQIDPYKYNFTIPNELSAGKYTLAWTWFNKVGNREMYMNCAPLTVTGKNTDSKFLASLPNMFVANIRFNGETCTVPADVDLKFPNAGKALSKYSGQGLAKASYWSPDGSQAACMRTLNSNPNSNSKPEDAKPAPSKPSKPASKPASKPPPKPSSTFVQSAPQRSKAAPAPQGSEKPPAFNESAPQRKPNQVSPEQIINDSAASQANGGVFMTIATPPPTSPGTTPTAAPGSPTTHPAGQKCTQEGRWNCVDGLSFQRCASGTWSVVQPLAAGVGCAKGESSDFPVSALPAPGSPVRRRVRIVNY